MSLQNRPYLGSWVMNRSLVRYATDAIVYINGFTEFASCVACNKMLDFGKYITNISVDASTESVSTANITLTVPASSSDVFSSDGNHVLQPNLEIVILLRGYFPLKNYAGMGQEVEDGFDANNVPVYPYYQVFRGVVTEATHEFSGGFYTATLQCANLLHFWQYLKLSVNGAVFGRRPDNSLVEPELIGHKFTGTNPYSIIYTLVKVGFGAAFGVDFQLSQDSNVAAVDDSSRRSMYAHAASWWAKRWTEHSGNLRMYGVDGSLFNAAEQAALGPWYDSKTSLQVTRKKLYTALRAGSVHDINQNMPYQKASRAANWNPYATASGMYQNGSGYITEDVVRMQAFTLDLGKMGAANMFETEYMSKQEIYEAVKTITGFEFYQDVDGDLVFKPPMYNLDTSADPVYRIADRDLISISENEGEPEATIMKGTGSHFANITGTGIDGWLGVGAVFIDYRLVARYGYREESFESNYLSSKHALFVSAINRLDLANVGVKSASITIPLRPEMRPGYPVYVEHLDCFYYVKSLAHAFVFGGQCTTALTCVAKRVKFLPPMETQGDRQFPSIDNVRLDAPDEFPAQPLIAYPERMAGLTTSSSPPRIYGFPNVILALDPTKTNMATVDVNLGILSAQGYVEMALSEGLVERVPGETDLFYLRTGNVAVEPVSLTTISQEWADASKALAAGTYVPELSSAFGQIVAAMLKRKGANVDVPDSRNLINYLALQTSLKGMFSPGAGITGKYRYYSCSHPNAEHQGPTNLSLDNETGTGAEVGVAAGPPDEDASTTSWVFKDVGGGKGVCVVEEPVAQGVRIADLSQTATGNAELQTRVVSTADVRFVTFGPQTVKKIVQISHIGSSKKLGGNFPLNAKETQAGFKVMLMTNGLSDPSLTVSQRFTEEYDRIYLAIEEFSWNLGISSAAANQAASKYVYVSSALTELGKPTLADQTLAAAYPKKADPAAASLVADLLAKGLWNYTSVVISEGKKLFTAENSSAFMGYRAEFLSAYTDGIAYVPDSDPSLTYLLSNEDAEHSSMTPIFPVSDRKGYEVYGNLPYGRGITIEMYASLLAPFQSTQGEPEPEETEPNVGSRGGSNAASLSALERFFKVFLDGNPGNQSAAQVLGSQSDTDQAAVLAYLNTNVEGIQAAVETLFTQDTSQNAKIRNSPVTSFTRGQSTFSDATARNLADIDIESETCACKGADSRFFLMAFSEENMDKYGDDPLHGYQEEQVASSGAIWQSTRDALSGTMMDTRNTNLLAEFTAGGSVAQAEAGLVRGSVNQIASLGSDAVQVITSDEG